MGGGGVLETTGSDIAIFSIFSHQVFCLFCIGSIGNHVYSLKVLLSLSDGKSTLICVGVIPTCAARIDLDNEW